MKLYTTFTVGDKEYKCRLSARASVDLEDKLGTNPINLLIGAINNEQMPSLKVLIAVLHASLQSLEHGMSEDKVYELYDKWVDEGNSYEDFLQLILSIFQNSGLISEDKKNKAEENAKN